MNILFLTYWYPSENKPGSGIFIKEHARAIDQSGNNVHILHINIQKSKCLLRIQKESLKGPSEIPVSRINFYTAFDKYLPAFHGLIYFVSLHFLKKRILPVFTPEILHSNVVYPAGIIGSQLSKKLKIPHIISEHWSAITKILNTPFRKILPRNAYKHARFICPVSYFLAKELQLNAEITDEQIQIIPNVIDGDFFKFRKKAKDPGRIKFIAVARWQKWKNVTKRPDLIIHSLAKLNQEIDAHIQLEMVGGGSMVPELKKLCEKLQLDTTFKDWLPKEELAEAYKHADFLIHASNIETFSIIIPEALKTGTPVIASNVGAIPELINEENGRLCENTIEDWLDNLKTLIATDFDHKKIAEEFRNRFTYHEIGTKLTDLYNKVVHDLKA